MFTHHCYNTHFVYLLFSIGILAQTNGIHIDFIVNVRKLLCKGLLAVATGKLFFVLFTVTICGKQQQISDSETDFGTDSDSQEDDKEGGCF